ncbi:MAG: hypothetical protein QOC92_60 [Acidimicrobiaceae bacterium]
MSAGSSPDIPLDAVVIEQYVAEVAEHLQPDGERRVLVVVGGALLAWHGLRDTTRDVDSVRRLDEELKAAVAAVGARHGLATTWLNDRAASFLPATFREDGCTVLLDHPALLVLGAPLDQVFLMKLYAARAADTADLEILWPLCSFESPEHAVAAFHDAYPHLEPDEQLAAFIRSLSGAEDL